MPSCMNGSKELQVHQNIYLLTITATLVILFESFKLGNNNAKHTHIMYDNNSYLVLTIITYSL